MPLPTTTTFSAPETSAVRRTYEIGGFRVRVDSFPFHESAFLAAFCTDDRRDPELCLTVRALPEIPAEAGIIPAPAGETVFRDGAGRRVRLRRKESGEALLYRVTETGPDALLAELAADAAPGLGSGLILRWLELPARLLARDALFLHASFVGLGERAILFTGPKQIGKSTQAELWRRCRGARVLNGRVSSTPPRITAPRKDSRIRWVLDRPNTPVFFINPYASGARMVTSNFSSTSAAIRTMEYALGAAAADTGTWITRDPFSRPWVI